MFNLKILCILLVKRIEIVKKFKMIMILIRSGLSSISPLSLNWDRRSQKSQHNLAVKVSVTAALLIEHLNLI